MRPTSALLLALSTTFLFACKGPEPRARIMGDNEKDVVGSTKIGAAGFDRLIDSTVAELLEPHKGDFADLKVRSLAFVDLDNRTAEELGDWRDHLIDRIEVSINKRRAFKTTSIKFLSVVMRKMGSPGVDEFALPGTRRKFASLIEQEKIPIQYLLYGRLTRGATSGEGRRQADYQLTLELVNVVTGENNTVGKRIRKEYRGS